MEPISLTPARVAVLHYLMRNGAADVPTLAARSNLAASLCHDFLTQLVARDLVRVSPAMLTGPAWELTVAGRALASRCYVGPLGEVSEVPY